MPDTSNQPRSANRDPRSAILGIGVDIVEIERLRRVLERYPRLKQRLFTPREREYCGACRAAEVTHLAGRFAAKEAVAKALGCALSWQSVEIGNGPAGRPQVILDDRARETAGGGEVLVSISHSRDYAVAYAMWLGHSGPEFLEKARRDAP